MRKITEIITGDEAEQACNELDFSEAGKDLAEALNKLVLADGEELLLWLTVRGKTVVGFEIEVVMKPEEDGNGKAR